MLKNTPAGYKKEYPWLKEVDSLALANVQGWKAQETLEDTLRSAWAWQLKLRERGRFSCAGECTVKSGRGFPEIFSGTGSGISAL